MVKKIVESIIKDDLFRNSIYLIANSVVLTGFGFFFWTICAKLYTSNDVGIASTIISALSLIVLFSGLGLGVAILRHLPNSPNKSEHISSSLIVSVLFSFVLSSIFVVLIPFLYPKLLFIQQNIFFGFIFVSACVLTVAATLLSSVFIALRDSKYVLFQSILFSLLKLILPIFLIGLGSMGIFTTWTIATGAGLMLLVFALYFIKNLKPIPQINEKLLLELVPLSFVNYLSDLFGSASGYIFPLLITGFISPTATAYYYVVSMMAGMLFIIPQSIARSLFAAGAANENAFGQLQKKAYIISFALVIPGALVMGLIGRYLLKFYGQEYFDSGSSLLILFSFASVLLVFRSIYSAKLNMQKRLKEIVFLNFGILIASIVSFPFLYKFGLLGVGLAWTIGQIVPLLFVIKDRFNEQSYVV